MIQLLVYFALCYIGNFLFFQIVQRPLFCYYNRKANSEKMHLADLFSIYRHGYKTDLAAAAYLTALPWLIGWITALLPHFPVMIVLTVYFVIAGLGVALLCIADMALYKFWRTKIDSSVLVYLHNLKGAFASVSVGYIIVAFFTVFLMAALYYGEMSWIACFVYRHLPTSSLSWWCYPLAILEGVILAGILFASIRGINSRPNSPSIAYYCRNMFYNHAAINPVYNFVYSFSIKEEFEGKFRFYDDKECEEEVSKMFPISGTPQTELLRTRRPNIVLVIWESLCAEYVEVLGGKKGVTENVNRLAQEGVLFTNLRSTSFRTDRGIVGILSGIPGQPTTSIIRYTKKLPNLPALPRTLKKEGYDTMVMHGGDLSVLHKSDYYVASGHDKLVSQTDFKGNPPTCRWGIHDNYMFDRLADEVHAREGSSRPWMITLQTLSSHQPFIVPYHRLGHKISNAYAFTDDAFGKFVEKMRQTPQWDNLLIIAVGDHGMNDNDEPLSHHRYSHIPLLMVGGAVKRHAIIDTPVCQTDLAATLLGQMGIDHSDFIYSRDVTADTYTAPFAMHSYTDGFVYSDATGYTDYDLVSGAAIENADAERERKGKLILQHLYSYLGKI